MKSALVRGANKSIGFEIVKQLAQKGFFVYLGCSNSESGLAAIEDLKPRDSAISKPYNWM